MTYRRIKTVILAVCLSLLATAAAADSQLEQRLAETKVHLNLTDEQVEQIRPVLKLNFTTSRAILAKYGVNPANPANNKDSGNKPAKLGFINAQKLRKELGAVRDSTLKKLGGMLTDDQLVQYRELQAERAAELRRHIRERHKGTRG